MTLETPRQVIAALGGVRPVAELTGRDYRAAWNWTKFPKFPANTFNVLQLALRKRGLDAPASLWGMSEAVDADADTA